MAYERGKKTYTATTIEAVVTVGKTRRLKIAESNIVIRHVFASLAESAKSFKQWDEAWEKATADGVVRYANKFKATARDTYVLSVPECLIEQRAMRDMRDALNGRTRPRGEPRRICKCADCRSQRRLEITNETREERAARQAEQVWRGGSYYGARQI